MENEDSRFALFSEPNAYIQRFEKKEQNKPSKIVFQEPYESMPAFYINNNFKKRNCNCVPNRQNKNHNLNSNNHDCDCAHGNLNNCGSRDDNCHHDGCSKQKGFGFDLKSLMPLMGLFNKSGGTDLSSLVGLMNNVNNSQKGNSSNPMNLISGLLSNKEGLANILNLFKSGGLFNKKQTAKKEIKTTDFEIKNYTRVE